MKLRITIDGAVFEALVEALPDAPHAGDSRVEGEPLRRVPSAPPVRGAPERASSAAAGSAPKSAPATAPASATHRPAPPVWHGLSLGPGGAYTAPVPGKIKAVLAAPGQRLRPGDALVHIEVSSVLSPSHTPLVGTVRASQPGVVATLEVKPDQQVHFGDVLVRMHEPAGDHPPHAE